MRVAPFLACPRECLRGGWCNRHTGFCACPTGRGGVDCAEDDPHPCDLPGGGVVASRCAGECDLRVARCQCGASRGGAVAARRGIASWCQPLDPAAEDPGWDGRPWEVVEAEGVTNPPPPMRRVFGLPANGTAEPEPFWCDASPRGGEAEEDARNKARGSPGGTGDGDGDGDGETLDPPVACRTECPVGWDDAPDCARRLPGTFCPNQCTGRGRCAEGFCECRPGWWGADCSLPAPREDGSEDESDGAATGGAPRAGGVVEGAEGASSRGVVVSTSRRRAKPLIFVHEPPIAFTSGTHQRRKKEYNCVPRRYVARGGGDGPDPTPRAEDALERRTAWYYSLEATFHEYLLRSAHRTTDPSEADFFFLPTYSACFHLKYNAPDPRHWVAALPKPRVRPHGTFLMWRRVAAHLGAALRTPEIADARWRNGRRAAPPTPAADYFLPEPLLSADPKFPEEEEEEKGVKGVGGESEEGGRRGRSKEGGSSEEGGSSSGSDGSLLLGDLSDHIIVTPYDEGGCYVPNELAGATFVTHWGNTGAPHAGATTGFANDDWERLKPKLGFPGRWRCYDPAKDLVVPPWNVRGDPHSDEEESIVDEDSFEDSESSSLREEEEEEDSAAAEKSGSAASNSRLRPTLFFFAGDLGSPEGIPESGPHRNPAYSMGIRQRVAAHLRDRRAEGFDIAGHLPRAEYAARMRNATFCGVFPGDGWSGGLVEYAKNGCVPVIVQDGIDMPFERIGAWGREHAARGRGDGASKNPNVPNVFERLRNGSEPLEPLLQYASFSVRVAERDVERLDEILRSIREDAIRAYRANLEAVADLFSYDVPDQPAEGPPRRPSPEAASEGEGRGGGGGGGGGGKKRRARRRGRGAADVEGGDGEAGGLPGDAFEMIMASLRYKLELRERGTRE